MDVTSVALGKQVRNDLRAFRDRNDLENYKETIKVLLSEATKNEDLDGEE